MRRVAALLLVALASCGEAPTIPDTDLSISLVTGARTVAFGAPFTLTVDRVWSASLQPEEWNDQTLLPLVVRERSVSVHQAGGHLLERRVFTAHAYDVGDVRVLPPLFVAVDPESDEERETSGEGFDLFVTATLDPEFPGAVEFPPGPPSGSTPWSVLIVGLGAALAAFALLVVTRRRRGPDPRAETPSPPPAVAPAVTALARLAALRGRIPSDAAQLPEFYDELSATVRSYVAARYEWGSEQLTSEELVAAAEAKAAAPGLRSLVLRCDLVRFALHDPGADGAADALSDAERFVGETSP